MNFETRIFVKKFFVGLMRSLREDRIYISTTGLSEKLDKLQKLCEELLDEKLLLNLSVGKFFDKMPVSEFRYGFFDAARTLSDIASVKTSRTGTEVCLNIGKSKQEQIMNNLKEEIVVPDKLIEETIKLLNN